MKTQFSIERFRIWLAIVLLAVIALGTIWVMETIKRATLEQYQRSSARIQPDYYVEQFNFIKLSNDGRANYHVIGDYLFHYPRADYFEIKQARINSFAPDRSPLLLKADRIVVEPKSANLQPARPYDLIHLYENVSVLTPDKKYAQPIRMETEYLMLSPDQDLMKTDKAISLTSARLDAKAIGMIANTNSEQVELLSQVKMRLKRALKQTEENQPNDPDINRGSLSLIE